MGVECKTLMKLIVIFVSFTSFAAADASDATIKLSFNLTEELPKDTLIGNLATESNLPLNNNNDLYFYIIPNQRVNISLFKTDNYGQLRVAAIIDREKECLYLLTCILTFDVAVKNNKDASFFQIITVTLNIVDINDNTPTFDRSELQFDVSETKPLRSNPIIFHGATDLDTGANNSVQSYELIPKDGNFNLSVSDNGDGTSTLKLDLVKSLDYETARFHILSILARDGGVNPQRTGTLTVTINVLDENDNQPKFVDSILNVTVPENIGVGKVILVLMAKDTDSGKNGEVSYELRDRQPDEIYYLFTINNQTGELSVKNQLEFILGKEYKTIYILARDRGTISLSSQATVYLTILSVGNKPPKVKLNLFSGNESGIVEVSEGSEVGSFVAHVNVEDPDTGQNGNVTCSIFNTYFGLERLGEKGYKVIIQHPLDRETIQQHKVTITCRDFGTPSLEATVSFVVKVTDENDNAPRFLNPTYIYTKDVFENKTYRESIIQVSAVDPDEGLNGMVSYEIAPKYSSEFSIDSIGTVRALIILDREAYAQKQFEVLAIDQGKEPKTSTATVLLNIIDVNDNPPIFIKPLFEFEVEEEMPVMEMVGKVMAVDEDQGENSRISYFMWPINLINGSTELPFSVSEDGIIRTKIILDREFKSQYEFLIGARDHGNISLNGSVRVIVKVKDINDNSPQFIFPVMGNNTITALNVVSKEVAIVEIEAADADENINAKLLYFIFEGNDKDIFFVDSDSGRLFIQKYIDIIDSTLFVLTISAQDQGQPPRAANMTLNIILKYSNATMQAHRQASAEETTNYIIIVVVVVFITLVISIVIIVIICVVRRHDIHACGSKKPKFPTRKTEILQLDRATQEFTNDKEYPEEPQHKSKKEVSFSLDESNSSRDFQQTLDKYAKTSPRGIMLPAGREEFQVLKQPSKVVQCTTPKLTQNHIKCLDGHNTQQKNANHHREDSNSEKSAESADSGNGSSEPEQDAPVSPVSFVNPLCTTHPSVFVISAQKPPVQSANQQIHKSSASVTPRPSNGIKDSPYKNFTVNPRQNDSVRNSLCQNISVSLNPSDSIRGSPYQNTSVTTRPNNNVRESCSSDYSNVHKNQTRSQIANPRIQQIWNRSNSSDSCYHSYSSAQLTADPLMSIYHDKNQRLKPEPSENNPIVHEPSIKFVPYLSTSLGYGTYSSRDDDESTTTSGSYVLDDDLDMKYVSNDCMV
ncbi:hypothetical protein CHS0354_041941 [Potamilus streckersoni]|uniref:Cadherin domain-containing protein n=1 Tax=Potamilus streckersoni TaxID=2493646 RepID=A0AAE0T9N0_9BIVA|nr:hypothetical protein CHS0354_041941 [Potamilus streckersoni]